MRRLFAILLGLGLLGATAGCHHTHGVCDCDLGPIGHDGPPVLAPAMPPLNPGPVRDMPKPVEKIAPPAASETPK